MKRPKLQISKRWLTVLFFSAFLLSLFFNDSFHKTLERRSAIKKAKQELVQVGEQVESLEKKLNLLEENSSIVEHLVRSELGYLRPGEKEVRFVREKRGEKNRG